MTARTAAELATWQARLRGVHEPPDLIGRAGTDHIGRSDCDYTTRSHLGSHSAGGDKGYPAHFSDRESPMVSVD